jgi:hypothetical protein
VGEGVTEVGRAEASNEHPANKESLAYSQPGAPAVTAALVVADVAEGFPSVLALCRPAAYQNRAISERLPAEDSKEHHKGQRQA